MCGWLGLPIGGRSENLHDQLQFSAANESQAPAGLQCQKPGHWLWLQAKLSRPEAAWGVPLPAAGGRWRRCRNAQLPLLAAVASTAMKRRVLTVLSLTWDLTTDLGP